MEAAYQRALERLYTLVGREYSLLVVVPDALLHSANTNARELVRAARAISAECGVDTRATGKTRCVIRGSVIRMDLDRNTATGETVPFGAAEVAAARGGRVTPQELPLIIALVGVDPLVVSQLGDPTCKERQDLVSVASGGYVALVSTEDEAVPANRRMSVGLCDKPRSVTAATKPRVTGAPKKSEPAAPAEPKFLVGTEVIDATRKMVYAIRIPPPQQVVAPPPPSTIAPTPKEPVRVIRDARWTRAVVAAPVARQAPTLAPPPQQPPVPVAGPEWEKRVQSAVERELTKILKPPPGVLDLGDGLVARTWPHLIEEISKARDWLAVFTHQSVDPTPQANYEAYETLGDKVLSLSLVHHLLATGRSGSLSTGAADSNSLTDINKEILSETRQPEMGMAMGLNAAGLIRSTILVDDKMLEDVFEAFFGCLFTVANRAAEGSNQGLPMCEALLIKVLNDVYPGLDLWSIPKDAPTVLDQLYQRLGWGRVITHYNERTGVTTIRLTREAHAHLESIGPPIRADAPLAVGPPAADIKKSKKAAAELALATLKTSWGIDTRYVSMIVRKRLMADERYASVQREALQIAQKLGFIDIYVARRAKHHNQLYAVMGVRSNGTEAQLHIYRYTSPQGEESEQQGRENMSTRVVAYITALRGFIATARAKS